MSLKLNPLLTALVAGIVVVSLSACGGADQDMALSSQTTASNITVVPANTVVVSSATAQPVANASTPAPDCAPENCSSLRIIDGNAEAWRVDAAKRAEREATLVQ